MTNSAWLRGVHYAENRLSSVGFDTAYREIKTCIGVARIIRTEFENGQLDYMRNYQNRKLKQGLSS